MTTTAFDDQFTVAPEPVRQPYDTGSILRRNVVDLEIALRKQTERAEKAEAELARMAKQEPYAYEYGRSNGDGTYSVHIDKGSLVQIGPAKWAYVYPEMEIKEHPVKKLYAAPVPAPAVPASIVPDGDDFNGSTPHLIQCMEALVRLDADGVLVPHGIGRDASKLLSAAANRLRQQAASSVPKEWRKALQEAHDTFQRYADLHQAKGTHDGYKKAKANQKLANKLYALLQSTGEQDGH